MKWRWVVIGLAAAVLPAFVALGFALRWWDMPHQSPRDWVESVSWIAGMVAAVIALFAWLSPRGAPALATTIEKRLGRNPGLLDRNDEYQRLHRLLSQDQPPSVVQVTGVPGVGKTMFVEAVLDDLQEQDPALTVYPHAVATGVRFDIRSLIGNLEGSEQPAELDRDETRLSRLWRALQEARASRLVILIEGAEHLALSGKTSEVDLQMDEALAIICAYPHPHRVTVLLVSRVVLASPTGRQWALDAHIHLDKLPRPDFDTFVKDREHLLPVPAVRSDTLYQRLAGNPRSFQLMVAIVGLPERGVDPDELLRTIAQLESDDVPRRLAEILIDNLGDLDRAVLQSLAAFRIPIDVPAVARATGWPVPSVTTALRRLRERELVVATGADWALTLADNEWLLPRTAKDRSALLRRVADELKRRRVPDPDSLNDLRNHFAYVDVLLAAGRYQVAYTAMAPMTDVLKRWSCGHLLIAQREKIRRKLGDPGLEMLNENELGDAYALRGDFPLANVAYGHALDAANQWGVAEISAPIRYNFGTYYWMIGRADQAYNYYEEARDEAEQHDLPAVMAAALEGLAECHRRWGEYDEAFARVHRLLAGAPSAGLLLRVARWRVEIGDTEVARDLIERAETVSRAGAWLHSARLDTHADLLLATGDHLGAAGKAYEALEKSKQAHNSVVVLQAHTTLCWTALHLGQWEEAEQHIEEAENYRTPGSALVVLGLNAVLHQRTDPGKAAHLFQKLAEEAGARLEDEKDLSARDMLGLATCGQALRDGTSPDAAIEHFSGARAPILRARRDLLVARLDTFAQPPGQLQSVLAALADSRSRAGD